MPDPTPEPNAILDFLRRNSAPAVDMWRNAEAGLANATQQFNERASGDLQRYFGVNAGPDTISLLTALMGGVKAPGKPGQPPLRLYHGSTDPDILTRFEPMMGNEIGPHLGTAEQANERLTQQSMLSGDTLNGMAILPVDASFRNPLELKDIGWNDLDLIDNLRATRKFTRGELRSLQDVINSGSDVFHEALTELLTKKGYDSIKYRNQFEHPSQTAALRANGQADPDLNLQKTGDFSYIPIKRNTVKSATTGQTLFSGAGVPTPAAIANVLLQSRQQQ